MKRFIAPIATALILTTSVSVWAANSPPPIDNPNTQSAAIDYQGFELLTKEVAEHRQSRLISKQSFLEFAADPNTIVLDTRSKADFDAGHFEGAVHLNFSEFTDEKLTKVIGDKDRRILIYCNNNFSDNVRPFLLKRIELALNIPTFINLYGYGYKNIYELRDTVSIADPQMKIVSTHQD